MTTINISGLIDSCDMIARHCITIGGGRHGSAWLFDKCMRAFDFPPCVGITFSVYINAPVMADGEVTINRDGTYTIRRV